MTKKEILKLAWPLIIANSFWNLQLTVDRVFLGMYSTEALGAAMTVMGIFWVPMALLQGTSGYITTFVAQYLGAKQPTEIGKCFWQSIYVGIGGGLLVLALNLFSPILFSMIGHSPSLQQQEIAYFNAVTWSALPTALVASISGFFTGIGSTQTVIGINLMGVLLNVLLDYLFVFGFNWGPIQIPEGGIAGAGYATALATYGSVAYGFFLVFKNQKAKNFQLAPPAIFNKKMTLQFLKFGLPSGAQWALEGLAFSIFLMIMGRYTNGEAALASSSIAVTVMMLSVLPSMGIAQAVLTLVGQSLGEKKPDIAEKTTREGIKLSLIYMSFMALSFVLFPQFYLSWFKNEENRMLWDQVSQLTPTLLKVVACFTILDSIYLNVSFALKGAGDTRFVSLVALLLPWPLMVAPAFFIKDWPQAAVWAWIFAAGYSFCTNLIILFRFKQGKWKTMSVIQSGANPQSFPVATEDFSHSSTSPNSPTN